MDHPLSIVVPVYHERENVRRLHERLVAEAGPFGEIVFVWDSPDDPTIPHIEALRASDPRVVSARNARGPGVLNALRTGIERARGEAILVAMGDLSDDPRVIPALVEAWRGGAAVVCPSRYMPGGSQTGGPALKSALSRAAGLSLHGLGALPVRDPTNNFKLYDARFLKSVTIESARGFELALELTVKAREAGLTIVEIPTAWTERDRGSSRFRLFKWMPGYLRWYFRAIRNRFLPARRPGAGVGGGSVPGPTPAPVPGPGGAGGSGSAPPPVAGSSPAPAPAPATGFGSGSGSEFASATSSRDDQDRRP